jgi:hypothetical protein
MASCFQKENIPPSGDLKFAVGQAVAAKKSPRRWTLEAMQHLGVREDSDGAAQPDSEGPLNTGSRELENEDGMLIAAGKTARSAQGDARPGITMSANTSSNNEPEPRSDQSGTTVIHGAQNSAPARPQREELSPDMLKQMLANCLKLASENVRTASRRKLEQILVRKSENLHAPLEF